ncbi:hypothetical protein LMG27174_05603 [Paraburkholderia rhynchosiae]|uniref:Uncharacterized protein n=1 Tax=Paraburkholderia rhynchosiae TaxID=487049 RepID=A0A6J5C728_9BURK|nr:hypothetical protein LMG27174_05603 [Paraburkholderia rhynchosiae]
MKVKIRASDALVTTPGDSPERQGIAGRFRYCGSCRSSGYCGCFRYCEAPALSGVDDAFACSSVSLLLPAL